jgi:DNA-binding PadR family transcriptional regulator
MARKRQPEEIGNLDRLILFGLIREPDATGYQIQQLIFSRTERMYALGSMYAALSRLESNGYVTSRKGEVLHEPGGKAKYHFKISGEGRRVLDASMKLIIAMSEGLGVGSNQSRDW